MSKHTPGPWRTDLDEHDAPCQDIRITDQHDFMIARVWQDDAPNMWEFNSQQIANARLIAAAPDLLEVLKLFVDCDAFIPNIGDARRADPDEEDQDEERRAVIYRMAATAIAKAEGRS